MTPDDLDRLEALAAAATPGEWVVEPSVFVDRVVLRAGNWSTGPLVPSDAAYIAALDPATVQQLVAAARLGAAWQAAEAALPEGWVVGFIGIAHGVGRWYTASAYADLTDYADDHEADSAQADTPAAALLSLAEALRGRK